jgi:hypothetical protein
MIPEINAFSEGIEQYHTHELRQGNMIMTPREATNSNQLADDMVRFFTSFSDGAMRFTSGVVLSGCILYMGDGAS